MLIGMEFPTDIDDLKRAEDRIRLIIDTIPTMAWTVRPDGAVDFVNQRWLDYTGLTLEEEVEEPMRVVHPEDLPRVTEKWTADMAAGKPSDDEIRLRRCLYGEYRCVPGLHHASAKLSRETSSSGTEYPSILRTASGRKKPSDRASGNSAT